MNKTPNLYSLFQLFIPTIHSNYSFQLSSETILALLHHFNLNLQKINKKLIIN
jgi:hypothetical protein